jgi:hypothetical protein
MNRPERLVARLLAVTAFLAAPAARGANGSVEGTVPQKVKVEAPAPKHIGFVKPIENPIIELRAYDPWPECFVFLEGGPAAADAATPPTDPVRWSLGSHSFAKPVLPVVAGSTISIDNDGRETHVLASPDAPDVIKKDPISPGTSLTATVTEAGKAVLVVAQQSPHVEGRIVALPSKYFATIDRKGGFRIDDVPPGQWTARIWFRDGWIAETFPVTVTNRTTKLEIKLTELKKLDEPKPTP